LAGAGAGRRGLSDCLHCDGLSRSRQLHRAAEAGAGLPAIERGMPLPAGTGMTRQAFFARSLGAMLAVYGGSKLGVRALEEGIAAAATGPAKPILVTVFLEGGADALSMLSPQGDPLYKKLRPTLALSGGTALTEDPRLFWHPALKGVSQLYAEGKVTVMPAIGYTNANQSHFTSRHFWEVGATDTDLQTGWLGRLLDVIGTPDNPLQGLSLDSALSPVLATTTVPVATLETPTSYDFYSQNVWGEVNDRMLDSIADLGAHQADPALQTAASVAREVDRLRTQLLPIHDKPDDKPAFVSPVAYPKSSDPFPERLGALAEMIALGMPIHAVAITAPGEYDTHSGEPAALTQGLQLTSDTLLAFQRDLEARKLADRVLVLVWSEFGRRAAQNGNNGTDHGAAGAGLLIGTHASGKLVGEFPGLGSSGLDADGNVRATSDFRGVYASLLEQWYGADAAKLIPSAGSFARPALLKT
jgi:uncharacterized protein (DUF1501 family)